jgi:hypothetical protein
LPIYFVNFHKHGEEGVFELVWVGWRLVMIGGIMFQMGVFGWVSGLWAANFRRF